MRSLIYVVISVTFVSLFAYFLSASTRLQMVFLRSKVPFRVLEQEMRVLNHFTLKLTHQGTKVFKVDFEVDDPDLRSLIKVVTNAHPTVVEEAEKKIVLFLKFDPKILESGTKKVRLNAVDSETRKIMSSKEVILVGPVSS